MKKLLPFTGFSEDTLQFLSDLKENNSVDWFHKNKSRYQTFLVEPAKAFVNELGPFLNQVNPEIRTEPKFNKTLMRINKDMRFAKGDPYRTYFLIHFGRFKMDSEFFVYFAPDEIQIGVFLNNTNGDSLFFKNNLLKFKSNISDVFDDYEINKNYDFYTLQKEPTLVKRKFSASTDFLLLGNNKHILLQKAKLPRKTKIFSADFIPETIKIVLQLYPLYCFAISSDPLKLLYEFQDTFG